MSDLYKNLRNLVLSTTGCKVNNHAISLILAWQTARKAPASGEPVAWNDPVVDPIVSKLYRKFKEWSERGFTADDVTWCEVRGYVAELMSAHPPAKVPESFILRKQAEAVESLRDSIKEQYPLEPFGDLDEYVIAGMKEVYTYVEKDAQRLRTQADELEAGGGSDGQDNCTKSHRPERNP